MGFPLLAWLLSLSFLILLFHNNTQVNSQCLDDQKTLLLELKQTISSSQIIIPTSSKLDSWASTTDCCTWEGVKCEDGNGHVTTLDLSYESINSTLFDNSTTLFQLQHLEKLNLAYNNFNPILIPTEFSHLVNLTHLNLSNSGFTGQVPIEITNLKRLVSLDLSTLFVGGIPLKLENPELKIIVGNLLELQELYLDGVNISNNGSEWCTALSVASKLRMLSLSSCELSGPFDESLSMLNSLTKLRLDHNSISAPLPEFFEKFTNLTSLSLGTCGLLGKFPQKIFQLPKLENLDLSVNPLLHGSLPEFPQNGSLKNLILSNTGFSGNLPDSIANLKMLGNLELSSCNFEGSVPNSVSNLTQLVNIDLSSNRLNGTIPDLGLSEKLTQINLAHNRLIGPIPSLWKNHIKLISLNLRNNSLSGTIPWELFRLPFLQKLYLSDNQFTGQLAEFSNVSSSLDTIDISGNQLEGSIPSSIFNVTGLIMLTVSYNNFNGTLQLDRFQNLMKLSSLDFSGNKLTIDTNINRPALFPQVSTLKLASCNLTTFPDFLASQSRLSFLDLSNNGIQGRIPSWIWKIGNGSLVHLNLSLNLFEASGEPLPNHKFSNLAVLDLHSNLLEGSIPILPTSATVLDYSSNNLSSTIPTDIGSYLFFTIFFSLSDNNVIGEVPASICNASYLQVLDLSNNNLSGRIPNCLGKMEMLGVLDLGKNNFDGTIPKTFSIQCNLRTLDLNGNMLEGKVSKNLFNCAMLEVLDLGNNQIEDTFPIWLGNLTNLRVLVLRSNKFHGVVPQRTNTGSFQMLQIIDLSCNYFEGNLSSSHFLNWKAMMITEEENQYKSKHQTLSFGVLQLTQLYYQDSVTVSIKGMEMELVKILTIFTSIDFSSNRFVGRIPETIGNLTSLYVLNLSHNGLNGPIPSSLGNLKQLESLDLSANKLSGEIPKQLADLSFISFLNLSFNQLAGRIPQGSQFQTFSNDSFIGNEELCGSPLSKTCLDTRDESYFNGSCNDSTAESCSDEGEPNWQIILTALGFVIGNLLAIFLVMFWGPLKGFYHQQRPQAQIQHPLRYPYPLYHNLLF